MSKKPPICVVRLIVLFLGAFMLLGLIGTMALVLKGSPGEAIALVSGLTGTALGSVGTLLSQTNGTQGQGETEP